MESNGKYVAVARGGKGLLASTLPCLTREEAERRIRMLVPNVEFGDDPMCKRVAEKIFKVFEGGNVDFNEAVDLSQLSCFQRMVLEEVRRIPRGKKVTYGEIAEKIGRPKAARAVGNALKRNPLPIIIPCHRVVGSKTLGGFTGGVNVKKFLLTVEGAL
ncbi:MAG: methylated-DNA--[protein]-cysteine S-methyltransferase [Candidatus Freyarchaeota archaeon]